MGRSLRKGMDAMEKKKLIVFTDIGDTIIDEGTEVRRPNDRVVYGADCIDGAKETYLELHARGYTVVMVADGLVKSFRNTMEQNGLDHIFADWIISEEVGDRKPAAVMFRTAMDRMGLTDADKGRVIMVGNNLARDIVGANRFGIGSVHFCWSPRYPHEASTPEEEPTYRIRDIRELLELAERLESTL